MITSIQSTTTLHNGVKMPWFGLGVYKAANGSEVIQAIKSAVNVGYRSIDTAAFYFNEEGVGKAIKETNVDREELFITTKVWNDDQGYEATIKAFDASLSKLDLDYLDLYLIHWPVAGKYKETWRALEHLYKEGRVKAIGVCNFQIHHLEDLMEGAEVTPMVNQVEYHPNLTQKDLHTFCKENGIQMEAWAPLKRGELFSDKTICKIAENYQKTPAQVILRWDLQNEVVTIPKSVTKKRIIENTDIFNFQLTEDEMIKITQLNKNERTGPHPDHFSF